MKLAHEIVDFGSEVGYHYEELSQFIKELKIMSIEDQRYKLDFPRNEFKKNYCRFCDYIQKKNLSVAAHGDFADRYLGVSNADIYTKDVEKELQIPFEAHSKRIDKHIDARVEDHLLIEQTTPKVLELISEKIPAILLLTHPRQWKRNTIVNASDDLRRVIDGIRYRYL